MKLSVSREVEHLRADDDPEGDLGDDDRHLGAAGEVGEQRRENRDRRDHEDVGVVDFQPPASLEVGAAALESPLRKWGSRLWRYR